MVVPSRVPTRAAKKNQRPVRDLTKAWEAIKLTWYQSHNIRLRLSINATNVIPDRVLKRGFAILEAIGVGDVDVAA